MSRPLFVFGVCVLLALALAVWRSHEPPAEPPAAATRTKLQMADLLADPAKAKVIHEGLELAGELFKQKAKLDAEIRGASLSKIEAANGKWRAWLDDSNAALGSDLRAQPRIVIEILDESRVATLVQLVKFKPGRLDWGSRRVEGYSRGRLTYAVLVPKTYTHTTTRPYPLVVSLHGPATNLHHPALREFPGQRSRIVVYNNWGGDGRSNPYEAIVIAPMGRPAGFSFAKDAFFARHSFYLALGAGSTDYRVDPKGTFVDVYGDMIQLALLDRNGVAGIIWRDRISAETAPLKPEEFLALENLRGLPLYYLGDRANWESVGKPIVETLTRLYKEAGKPENFFYEEGGVERDANGALKADAARMEKFLLHRKQTPVREFEWLFWNASLVGPLPIYLSRANYDYESTPEIEKMPLKDRCGSIKFKVDIAIVEEGGKQVPINLIELEITEADQAHIYLYEDLVNLDLPVTVMVNGAVVIDKQMVQRDWSMFEKVCMPRRFFLYPFVAQLDLEFPLKPRVDRN